METIRPCFWVEGGSSIGNGHRCLQQGAAAAAAAELAHMSKMSHVNTKRPYVSFGTAFVLYKRNALLFRFLVGGGKFFVFET